MANNALEMVEIAIERDHHFKSRGVKEGNSKVSPGCKTCGKAKLDACHLGSPPSMNNHSIALNDKGFAGTKAAWQHALASQVEASGLPRGVKIGDHWIGIQSIYVTVLIGFDEYREVDEGNHRWMVEKSLGDGLVSGYGFWKKTGKGPKDKVWIQVIEGGWLPSDSFWPIRRYSMGNLEAEHTPGESSTRLQIYASYDIPEAAPRGEKRSRRRVVERGGDVDPLVSIVDA